MSSLIPTPPRWLAPVVAVLALSAAAALPLVATAAVGAAATAQQREAGEPAEQPADPLAGTEQPVEGKGPSTTPATRPAEAQTAHESFADPLLAERFSELAQNRLREKVVTEAMWRQAAALLEAASRTNPRDPRFYRLLVEARLKLGDTEGAIKTLVDYRKLDPADRVAQVQLIDLYAAGMQTADGRLEYLRDIVGRSTVPPEVRSHAAALCVPLLLERSRDEALAMLDEALRLNPVSPEANRLRYGLIDEKTTPAQRCAVLLSLLRSNPAQPDVINELADLLASAGMSKDAIEWYSVALRLYPRLGRPYPDGLISDLGTQLLLSGQNDALETLLGSYLKARPDDPDAWFMRLAKEKLAGDKANPQVTTDARQALTARWSAVADRIAGRDAQGQGGAAEAVQPDAGAAAPAAAPGGPGLPAGPGGPGAIGVPGPVAAAPGAAAPDPTEAARRIKSGEAEQFKPDFVGALTDLAWFELFFAERPEAAAKPVAALKEVLPPDSATVARLEGWLALLQDKPDEARAKLAPVADRDPLSALGLVRLAGNDAKAQAEADDTAARLLRDYPRGLIAAIVRAGVKGRAVKPATQPAAGATEVAAELQKFPKDWMEILNQPASYYKLTADVIKVAHRYGEPLMARIKITNVTDYDLSVGPDGVLRPDLWFDARLGGMANQAYPGVAYDRIARRIVLPAREGFEQTLRIDQGQLGMALASSPTVSTQVLASVVTNPVSLGNGGVGPGPGGVRQPFKTLSRAGFPLSQPAQRKRVMTALESAPPTEKMRNLELVAACIQVLSTAKQLDEPTRAIGAELTGALTQERQDAVPAVATYATYLAARMSSPEGRGELVEKLAASENWPARLMGLIAANGMPADKATPIAEKLAQGDPDPVVRQFAAATVEYFRNPPATQPSTQPATQPAGAGAPGQPPSPAPDQTIGGGDPSPIPSGLSVPSQPAKGPAGQGN